MPPHLIKNQRPSPQGVEEKETYDMKTNVVEYYDSSMNLLSPKPPENDSSYSPPAKVSPASLSSFIIYPPKLIIPPPIHDSMLTPVMLMMQMKLMMM